MKQLFIVLILVIATACHTDPFSQTYVVPAGSHFSHEKGGIVTVDAKSFCVQTDSTWYWSKPDKNGWSKVLGLSWNSNHKNSVRLVYMRLNDSTGVFGYYYYLDGVSPMENRDQVGILDTISIGKSYQGRLGWSENCFFVTIGDKSNSYYVGKPFSNWAFKILANPYIGGTYVINHDWITTISYW